MRDEADSDAAVFGCETEILPACSLKVELGLKSPVPWGSI